MNTLTAIAFACLALYTSAVPSGHWNSGYGHGHLPLKGSSGVVTSEGAFGPAGVVNKHGAIGPNGEHNSLVDDHWEGGHGGNNGGHGHGHGHLPVVGPSGIVTSTGAKGPAGYVNGHGAVGPNGEHNSLVDDGHDDGHGDGGQWNGHDNAGYGGGHFNGHHDGQWHGEGLLESQDLAGHGGHGHGHW